MGFNSAFKGLISRVIERHVMKRDKGMGHMAPCILNLVLNGGKLSALRPDYFMCVSRYSLDRKLSSSVRPMFRVKIESSVVIFHSISRNIPASTVL
jgi:hypothetical protein